ncbi:signal peptidase II [Nitratireductor mangrovi]|uniref:Lipoprotein signal peptidase n=1 Tax=Nitratireductor mangrovi TaxID=2599600 RepID=A0A5B8L2F3_9HYPH|nr:signal peptidase II [Nitratireductor mangrovi]QDZ02184.1 signal peptidase II [Nitratireductor mangrovi]
MRLLACVLVAAAGIVLDQWIKGLVTQNMTLHEQIDLLPFLALFYAHNYGIAFSLFSSLGDLSLIIMTSGVVLFILWLASRTDQSQLAARLGFALIVAGALGNLIDRVTLGYVVDYVLFHTPNWSFAVFNLADAMITVGAGLVLLEEFFAWRRQRG